MKIIDNKNTKMIPLHFLEMGDVFESVNELYLYCHESDKVPNGIECFNLSRKIPCVKSSDILVVHLSDVTLTINR